MTDQRGTYFDNTGIDSLPDDWRHYCQLKRPDLDPDETFDMFTDHWTAASGQNARKRSWVAAWRNWVRNQWVRKQQAVDWRHYAAENGYDANIGESERQWQTRVELIMRGH